MSPNAAAPATAAWRGLNDLLGGLDGVLGLVWGLMAEIVADVDDAAREVIVVVHWRGRYSESLHIRFDQGNPVVSSKLLHVMQNQPCRNGIRIIP